MKNICRRVTLSIKMQVIDLHLYVKCHSSTGTFHAFCWCKSTTWFLHKWKTNRRWVKQQASWVSSQLTLIDFRILKFPRKDIFDITANTEAILKRCPDRKVFWNVMQIFKRTPILKCDFNLKLKLHIIIGVPLQLHFFRTPFCKNTPRILIL